MVVARTSNRAAAAAAAAVGSSTRVWFLFSDYALSRTSIEDRKGCFGCWAAVIVW